MWRVAWSCWLRLCGELRSAICLFTGLYAVWQWLITVRLCGGPACREEWMKRGDRDRSTLQLLPIRGALPSQSNQTHRHYTLLENLQVIFLLQKRTLRCIDNKNNTSSSKELLNKILTVPSLYIYEAIMYIEHQWCN